MGTQTEVESPYARPGCCPVVLWLALVPLVIWAAGC